MTQDTRKDPRAKIVSLNVRYKSATVDEFIENHSHDVSKGGVFIKTPNAFPPGTLLKFEIRIAGDKAVIVGVGRVVWKREAVQGAAERPAGMGVKFIKIDDSSRVLIDKLVATKSDAGRAFDIEQPQDAPPEIGHATARGIGAAKPVSMAPGGDRKQTMMGMGHLPGFDAATAAAAGFQTGTDDQDLPAAVPKTLAQKFGPAPTAMAARIDPAKRNMKSTLVGLPPPDNGASPPAAEPQRPSATPSSTSSMFPGDSVNTAPAGPAKEQTVMKQAAELLEEALKEAGGSMDEIGHNPLFSGSAASSPQPSNWAAEPQRAATATKLPTTTQPMNPPIAMDEVRPSANVPLRDSSPSAMAKSVSADSDPFASTAKPSVDRAGTSGPVSVNKESPSNRPVRAADPDDTVRRTLPRTDATLRTKRAAPPKKSNALLYVVSALIVVGAAAGGLYKRMLDNAPPAPPAVTAMPVVTPPPPVVTPPPPAVTATTPPVAAAAPSPSVAPSASALAPSSATLPPNGSGTPSAAKAAAVAPASATKPAAPPRVAMPPLTPIPPPVTVKPAADKPAPVAKPPAPAAVPPPKPPADKPAPKPKPPADDSDNPY